MSKLIAVLSLLATLAIAYRLDRWMYLLQKQASMDFTYARFFWISAAANILIAGLWVFLAWWMLFRSPRSWWVGGIFLYLYLLPDYQDLLRLPVSPTVNYPYPNQTIRLRPGVISPESRSLGH